MINLNLTPEQMNHFDYLTKQVQIAEDAHRSAHHNGRRDSHEAWLEDRDNFRKAADNLENFLKPFGVKLSEYRSVKTNPIPGIDFFITK